MFDPILKEVNLLLHYFHDYYMFEQGLSLYSPEFVGQKLKERSDLFTDEFLQFMAYYLPAGIRDVYMQVDDPTVLFASPEAYSVLYTAHRLFKKQQEFVSNTRLYLQE